MNITDENLVQQIKLKNEDAIIYLVKKHGSLLNGILRKYLFHQNQDIEECFADVLVSIWFHINSFDPNKNEFKQWIAAIAKYKAIDYLRKIEPSKKHTSNLEVNERLAVQLTIPPQHDLNDLINELNVTEQLIFHKYYVEGVPPDEIASELQVKSSWIYNKLSRGRKKLKSYILKGEV